MLIPHLPDPDCILAPSHPCIILLATLLSGLRFPDLPELEVLITSSGSHRRTIRTERTTKYSTIMCWDIVDLFE